MNTQTHNPELVNYALEGMGNIAEGQEACDLHHELFNTDYFIIGTYDAKKWLEDNPGVFEAIEEIREYEQSNFGQVSTDFSNPEKVVNMYAYIKGEEILGDCPTVSKRWNKKLSKKDIEAIKEELQELVS
jgi:hypothetical protein